MKHPIIRHACLTLALTGLAACGGGGEGATKTDAGTGDARRDGDAGSLAGAGGRGGGGGGSGRGGTGGSFISSGGSGGPVAGADGGVTTDGPGGAPGTGGGVTSSGGSGASGGIPASGGAGGRGAGTGGTLGTGGGAVATGGGAMGTGGSAATGGRVGSGGTSATGGLAGTGGAVGTGGAAVTTGGSPGTGGTATGGAATGGAGTGGAGTGGAGTGGAGTGGAGTGGAGTGGAGTGGAGTGGAGTGGAAGATTASVYVVAHPDDDLLFMNPDLEADIVAGKAVTTVYVTSGDAGAGITRATSREASVRSAHAAMAMNAADIWTCAAASYAGKSPQRCFLPAHPSVRAIYLRILDGAVQGLADGSSAGTVDNSTTYTAAQLTAVLAAIQAEVQPGKVGVLDASKVHGPDHDDHIASAQFALDVARADGVARQVTMYRGYSMAVPMFVGGSKPANEAENLVTTGQYPEKLRIIHAYQSDPLDDGFDDWCRRMYPLTSLTGGPAPLHTAGGQCLQTGATSGSAVSVATCNGAAAQNWTVTSTGRVLDSTGKCLGVVGDGVVVETCDASADERWSLLSDGELKGPTDQCAQVSGTAVTSSTCTSDMAQPLFRQVASQRWNF